MYLVSEEMNKRYVEKRIKNFEETIEELQALMRERYPQKLDTTIWRGND